MKASLKGVKSIKTRKKISWPPMTAVIPFLAGFDSHAARRLNGVNKASTLTAPLQIHNPPDWDNSTWVFFSEIDVAFLWRFFPPPIQSQRERERANHSPRWPNETPLRPFRALLYKKLIKLAFSAAAWKHGWNGVWHANNVFVGACKHLKRVVKIYIDFWCLSDCFKKKYSANWNWQLAIRLKSNCAYRKSGELTEKSEVCNRLCPEVEIVA